jgi:hypothetical protein
MHRNYLIGLILIVILMFPNCTTTKMYEGAELPSDKVAILKADTGMGMFRDAARIVTVDGQSPGFNDMQLAVLAGKHTLEIQVLGTYFHATRFLTFEAEAGCTYIARGAVWEEGAMIWLEDSETGKVAAGQKPQ